MSKNASTGIILVSIWFFIAGLLLLGAGAGGAWVFFTIFAAASAVFGPAQLASIVFLVIAVLMIAGAILYWIGAVGLLQAKEWGRRYSIIAAIFAGISWPAYGLTLFAIISIGSLGFLAGIAIGVAVVPVGLGILNVLPIFYLRSDEVRYYCGGDYEGPIVQSTVPATPPMPVMAVPPPVSANRAEPRLPATEFVDPRMPPAAWLVARSGSRSGQQYGLKRARNRIGRDGTQCQVVLDDSTISKLHAEISYENGRFMLTDFNALNGTFVNDRRVQKQGLLDGDEVRLGNVKLVFKEVTEPARR